MNQNTHRIHTRSLHLCILNAPRSYKYNTTDSHHCKDFLVFNLELVLIQNVQACVWYISIQISTCLTAMVHVTPEAKYKDMQPPFCCLIFCKRVILLMKCFSLKKICYFTKFQDPIISGISVSSPHKFLSPSRWYYRWQVIIKWKFGAASTDIMYFHTKFNLNLSIVSSV